MARTLWLLKFDISVHSLLFSVVPRVISFCLHACRKVLGAGLVYCCLVPTFLHSLSSLAVASNKKLHGGGNKECTIMQKKWMEPAWE